MVSNSQWQKFARFLKNNHLYERFIYNTIRQYGLSRFTFINERVRPRDFMLSGFNWSQTAEGVYFWSDRSLEWIDYYDNLIFNE